MIRLLFLALVVLVAAEPARGYSHFTVTPGGARVRWQPLPGAGPNAPVTVRWFATDRGVPGVTASGLHAALARAFATWEAVPTAAVAFAFVGFTSAEPFEDDDLSVLGFQEHPELERVLGAATFLLDVVSGELVEADVFFNAAFPWSTAPEGSPGAFDLESVALHEIGHFVGLGHSAIGETEIRADDGRRVIASGTVMFPISLGRGSTADRQLQPDDIAGVSDLYPARHFRDRTGAVRGRVLRDGRGVRGAHIVAFNLATGALVGGFSTGENGEFQIAGLAPGAYVLRVEPLDDADIESFFSPRGVDIDFQVTFHPRLFVAPAGGVGERVEITVRPK